MSTVPTLPTTWTNASLREDNLANAVNDIAVVLNTMFPLGTTWADWTPALTATTTNPTLGTASVARGRYFRVNKLVVAEFQIKFGTSGENQGSGAYRISLPVPCTTGANTNSAILGYGHIRDSSEGFLGLGPASYRGVTLHTAPSVSTSVVGIVLNSNLPNPTAGQLSDAYTITNEAADRTYDANATSIDEIADVLGTLVNDLDEAFKQNLSDNCAAGVPWTWAANDEIIGVLLYEAA